MRTEPHPEARPRLVLGTAMIALPVLGLWHLWSGAPQDPADRQRVAGFVGFAIGGPLSDGLTAVDRHAAADHRRAVRPAAGDRHDHPRGARHAAGDVHAAPTAATPDDDEYDEDAEYDDVRRPTPAPRTSPTATTTTRSRRPRRRGADLARPREPVGRPGRRWTTTRWTKPSPTRPRPCPSPGPRPSARSPKRRADEAEARGDPGRSTASSRGRTSCRRWTCWSRVIRRSCAAPPTTR